jgi:hypothetical protein
VGAAAQTAAARRGCGPVLLGCTISKLRLLACGTTARAPPAREARACSREPSQCGRCGGPRALGVVLRSSGLGSPSIMRKLLLSKSRDREDDAECESLTAAKARRTAAARQADGESTLLSGGLSTPRTHLPLVGLAARTSLSALRRCGSIWPWNVVQRSSPPRQRSLVTCPPPPARSRSTSRGSGHVAGPADVRLARRACGTAAGAESAASASHLRGTAAAICSHLIGPSAAGCCSSHLDGADAPAEADRTAQGRQLGTRE